MRTSTKNSLVLTVAILGLGCATVEENEEALGAALGGVAGGAICALAGGNSAQCLASAAGAALAGWGVVKVKQVMEHRSDLTQKVSKPSIKIREYQLQPSVISPGQAITAKTTFDLLTPDPRPVTQTFKFQNANGDDVASFTAIQDQVKQQGRYEVAYDIPVPNKAPVGRYRLVQELDAQTASPEKRSASFDVVRRVAQALPTPDVRSSNFLSSSHQSRLFAGNAVRVRQGEWEGTEDDDTGADIICADVTGNARENAVDNIYCGPKAANYAGSEILIFSTQGRNASLVARLDDDYRVRSYRR